MANLMKALVKREAGKGIWMEAGADAESDPTTC
jgi:hypothetical protein